MNPPPAVRVRSAELYFLPVKNRVPLKFGAQVVEQVTCARVRVRVEDARGRSAKGWGETPLSVAWVWPSALPWEEREQRMRDLCIQLAEEIVAFDARGHPLELGHAFQDQRLTALLAVANSGIDEPMPHLAALVCHSLFDLAIFDAFGQLVGRTVFDTLDEDFLSSDLAQFYDGDPAFVGKRLPQFLKPREDTLPVWHLVGGLDPLDADELTGREPRDGYPILLRDWIRADGLKCLKVKLRGNDAIWDYERLVRVGTIAIEEGCDWLTADFNCTVTDPAYVCEILDRLLVEHSRLYGMTLYIEQPFPYDLEAHRIDVRSVSARKPLFLDESAHDWRCVRLGRELGWTGVALKTCKTLTGALLSLAWARAHGMTLMVQDLTNPMLAQIPHVLLAAHAGTIMGVESNAMQFYPEASAPERAIHPGVFTRRNGVLDLSTMNGPGFSYRVDEIARVLPEPVAAAGG
ncbi:MAG TPA: mandelate racemase/muconate lactonizing enzyme family protein [Chthoniobacteraceae bacterium]|nr:mandelate racemase/muconate lactonizing enzyme family protein [Chthoniobacteraceae bacterium]